MGAPTIILLYILFVAIISTFGAYFIIKKPVGNLCAPQGPDGDPGPRGDDGGSHFPKSSILFAIQSISRGSIFSYPSFIIQGKLDPDFSSSDLTFNKDGSITLPKGLIQVNISLTIETGIQLSDKAVSYISLYSKTDQKRELIASHGNFYSNQMVRYVGNNSFFNQKPSDFLLLVEFPNVGDLTATVDMGNTTTSSLFIFKS